MPTRRLMHARRVLTRLWTSLRLAVASARKARTRGTSQDNPATAEQAGAGVAANRRRFWADLHAGQQLAEEAAARAGRGSTRRES